MNRASKRRAWPHVLASWRRKRFLGHRRHYTMRVEDSIEIGRPLQGVFDYMSSRGMSHTTRLDLGPRISPMVSERRVAPAEISQKNTG